MPGVSWIGATGPLTGRPFKGLGSLCEAFHIIPAEVDLETSGASLPGDQGNGVQSRERTLER
jgi:hypothetical protein